MEGERGLPPWDLNKICSGFLILILHNLLATTHEKISPPLEKILSAALKSIEKFKCGEPAVSDHTIRYRLVGWLWTKHHILLGPQALFHQ